MTVMSRLGIVPSLVLRLAAPKQVNFQSSQSFRSATTKCTGGLRGRGSTGLGLGRKNTPSKSAPKEVKNEKPAESPESHAGKDSNGGHSGPEINLEFTPLGRYFLYTALSVPVMYTGCIIWRYENVKKHKEMLDKGIIPMRKESSLRQSMNNVWNQLSPERRMVYSLIGVNMLIFGLWRIPALSPIMQRYFTCLPAKGYSVFGTTLSSFSHQGSFHLIANMYVLQSFSPITSYTLGGKEHFLALFLSGATFSALCSSIYKVRTLTMIPSVGASGGILAILALVCMAHPKSELSIAFVSAIFPHSFTAQNALAAVITLDIIGLLCGWRVLDHAGHLGGTLFGLFYYKYGKTIWLESEKFILRRWHYFRTGKKVD